MAIAIARKMGISVRLDIEALYTEQKSEKWDFSQSEMLAYFFGWEDNCVCIMAFLLLERIYI
jgi:hypothetical protein